MTAERLPEGDKEDGEKARIAASVSARESLGVPKTNLNDPAVQESLRAAERDARNNSVLNKKQ